jgi:uncharacterized membrane protein (DUF485 family)
MDEVQVERILQNPKFKEMVSRKSKLSWTLTIIMLVIYVGFMLLVGYNKEFLMSSFSGGVTTWEFLSVSVSSSCLLFYAGCIRTSPTIHLTS